MAESKLNIYKKIHTIMKEVGDIPKNGRMDTGKMKYDYVIYDDIVARINDLMVAHGVISYHKDTEVSTEEITVMYNNEGTITRVNNFRVYKAKVVYVDVESGEELETGPFYGEATRGDDKGIRKAERQASKIADLTTFKIVTGEPDYGEQPSAEPAEPKESRALKTAQKGSTKKVAPKKDAAPKVDNSELTALQAKLGTKFGSKAEAINAGAKKFPDDKNWATNVEKLKELLNDSPEA